jgi:hypothetical protein
MYWEWSHPKKQIYRSLRFGIGPLLKINQPARSRFPSVAFVPHPLPLVSPAPPRSCSTSPSHHHRRAPTHPDSVPVMRCRRSPLRVAPCRWQALPHTVPAHHVSVSTHAPMEATIVTLPSSGTCFPVSTMLPSSLDPLHHRCRSLFITDEFGYTNAHQVLDPTPQHKKWKSFVA